MQYRSKQSLLCNKTLQNIYKRNMFYFFFSLQLYTQHSTLFTNSRLASIVLQSLSLLTSMSLTGILRFNLVGDDDSSVRCASRVHWRIRNCSSSMFEQRATKLRRFFSRGEFVALAYARFLSAHAPVECRAGCSSDVAGISSVPSKREQARRFVTREWTNDRCRLVDRTLILER